MNVLMLVHGLGVGGAEVMVCHLARYLRRLGCSVEIACLGEIGGLGQELHYEGIDVVLYRRRPGFDRTLPVRLARRIRAGGFDVVHAHQRTGLFYGLLAGMLHAAPFVYSEHGPLFGGPPSRGKTTFNRVLGWRARRITAVSEGIRKELNDVEGFAGRQIDIVRNGVDLGRFGIASRPSQEEARRHAGLPLEGSIMASVGRLAAVKNQRLLVHVAGRLRHRFDELLLVLVGEGPERGEIEALADRLGLRGKVLFLGERRDVEDLLPAFDVFCLSSLSEGVPLTLLEAMASRVPVVATSVGGIPEAARPDHEAILIDGVPPDCRHSLSEPGKRYIDAFARAVGETLQNGVLRERLVRNAYDRVNGEFAMEVVCDRYERILTDAAARIGGA